MSSTSVKLGDLKFDLFLKRQQIKHAIENVAAQIDEDYKHVTPLFLSVLNGSFMFTAELMQYYKGLCEVSFVKLASYSNTTSTGKVNELIGLNENIEGRDVIVIEDIVDTGHTITKLYNELKELNPISLKICTLLYKPEAYHKQIAIDYVGIEIPNKFVVGYGLDYNGLGRNLSEIYQLAE